MLCNESSSSGLVKLDKALVPKVFVNEYPKPIKEDGDSYYFQYNVLEIDLHHVTVDNFGLIFANIGINISHNCYWLLRLIAKHLQITIWVDEGRFIKDHNCFLINYNHILLEDNDEKVTGYGAVEQTALPYLSNVTM